MDHNINDMGLLFIPDLPGIYVIKWKTKPIYVGQAVVLSNRFGDYKQRNTDNLALRRYLYTGACTFSFSKTRSLDFHESVIYWYLREQNYLLVNDPKKIPFSYEETIRLLRA